MINDITHDITPMYIKAQDYYRSLKNDSRSNELDVVVRNFIEEYNSNTVFFAQLMLKGRRLARMYTKLDNVD
jgi:hypothetical protein